MFTAGLLTSVPVSDEHNPHSRLEVVGILDSLEVGLDDVLLLMVHLTDSPVRCKGQTPPKSSTESSPIQVIKLPTHSDCVSMTVMYFAWMGYLC